MKTRENTIVTVVHGDYHDYLSGWISSLRATGCCAEIHLIILDAKQQTFSDPNITFERDYHPKPTWGDGDYIRLRRIRELCNAGQTCLQIDLDCLFNIDPTIYTRLPQSFIISRGLGFPTDAVQAWGFSLCTGFYIAKPEAVPLLDEWLAIQSRNRRLDQEDLNQHLLEVGVNWRHAVSPLVSDAFVVSTDERIAVLSDRAVTRDARLNSFGGIHSRSVLRLHRAASGTAQ